MHMDRTSVIVKHSSIDREVRKIFLHVTYISWIIRVELDYLKRLRLPKILLMIRKVAVLTIKKQSSNTTCKSWGRSSNSWRQEIIRNTNRDIRIIMTKLSARWRERKSRRACTKLEDKWLKPRVRMTLMKKLRLLRVWLVITKMGLRRSPRWLTSAKVIWRWVIKDQALEAQTTEINKSMDHQLAAKNPCRKLAACLRKRTKKPSAIVIRASP